MTSTYRARAVDRGGAPIAEKRGDQLPAEALIEIESDDHPGYTYRVAIERVGNGLELDEVAVIRGIDAAPITALTLREVQVGALIGVAGAYVSGASAAPEHATWGDTELISMTAEPPELVTAEPEKLAAEIEGFPRLEDDGRGSYRVPSDLAESVRAAGPSDADTQGVVAWLYKFAEARELAPVAFIEAALGLTRSTSSNWVAAARRGGALPPATRRPRTSRA